MEKTAPSGGKPDRKAREAAALRANLLRRKTAARTPAPDSHPATLSPAEEEPAS